VITVSAIGSRSKLVLKPGNAVILAGPAFDGGVVVEPEAREQGKAHVA
jgi:hypothetical protein